MLDKGNIPKHVAIIMDGNGRWAQAKGLPRIAGHRQGIRRAKEVIKCASELGIDTLTLFAFSAENWRRPKKETDMLMNALAAFLKKNTNELNRENIRLKVIGRQNPLPNKVLDIIKKSIDTTKKNTGLNLCLALNYGSRQEIVDAARKILNLALERKVSPEEINENNFSQFLYTYGLSDPDLLIRTSGEQRLSNFLLWQISYAELYFAKRYWPDFGRQELEKAIRQYQKRERRFGAVSH